MEGRGTIDVVLSGEPQLDDAIRIEVADDGPGMDATTRAKLFDPFFSTKPVGQGTGMGLSVVHGLVSSWGGHIDVDSKPSAGTRVILTLPEANTAEGLPNLTTAEA